MTSLRLGLALVAAGCFLRPAPLPADDAVPPFAMEKHYSANLAITIKNGMNIQSKTFIDDDKMRSDVTMNGMAMSIIVRKDEKKMFQVMDAQKMVMELDFNPDKFPGGAGAGFGPEGKFELIGPEAVDGVACTKYKVTPAKTKQVFFFWLDPVRKIPVEMAAVDGSLTVKWKNFVPGIQDASLFEPPAGYQVMDMPDGMGLPGGG
jgi:hypothetical protein